MAEKNHQIIRKDIANPKGTTGSFLELLNDSFGIGKEHLRVVNYDTAAEKGSRQTAKIDIFVDAWEWLQKTNEACLHVMEKALLKAKEANSYDPVWQVMGGIPAETLKARGQERPDGKGLSRTMAVCWGKKYPVVITARSGPGEQNDKGLIVPKYGNKPEQAVLIPLSYDDFLEVMIAGAEAYKAYLVYYYAHEKPFLRDNGDNGGKKPQTRY